ncbi:MAG: methionine ABC transporter permease [Peptoniphilus grossensis]|uniref:methionine ABC transporter permease n=1 Tax=Peptoniphilus grossensis TaxID=1465756 RepID=UPI00258D9523|nr:methionine ABC transporter permease [Peptoniphilus grossensis]MDU5100213.1 methionine ABC transporter permease [Peptoniphilus grossensis]
MERIIDIVLPAIPETLVMVLASTIIALLIGLPLGIVLTNTRPGGLTESAKVYSILDGIINILRSFPFVILMIVVFPLSRLIVGKSYGTAAMIIPLSLSAAPFVARLMEGYFIQVDSGIIEAAKSMGSTNKEIIFKVLIPEAMPMLVSGITMTLINVIGYSAMAGVMGGGGLGDVANRYGYQRNEPLILWSAVIVIIILVQIVQFIGNKIAENIDKR